jgi:hypothetical protein
MSVSIRAETKPEYKQLDAVLKKQGVKWALTGGCGRTT